MNKPFIVIGGGGHAKVIVDLLESLDRTILGFVDPDGDAELLGYERLGDDGFLSGIDENSVELALGVGSISSQATRKRIFSKYIEAGFSFPVLIHPSAYISKYADLSPGCQVMAGVVVQPGTNVGQNVILNTSSSIDHDCRIGDHCHIAPGAVLSGQVIVENEVHIGTGARVIQSCTIGTRSIIAAGTTVFKDISADTTVIASKPTYVDKSNQE